jgi:hypothetical protein
MLSGHLGIWATAIVNNAATLTCPPHGPEFNKIIYGSSNASSIKKSEIITSANSTALPPIIHYNLAPSSGSNIFTSPPRKRQRRSIIQINSSPIGSYAPHEYYRSALRDYTSWCAKKYEDDEFIEAFQQLQKEKIGIDLIEKISIEILTAKCGLTHGTAERIKENFCKWKMILESHSNVIYLNITMTKLILSYLWSNYRSRYFQNFIRQFLKTFSTLNTILRGSF